MGKDEDPEDGLTYADAGVDVEASETATAALVSAVEGVAGDYAGLLDIGDRYLALTTDGVGTKLLVAEAMEEFSTVGVDCVAMNVNDLVAAGVEPVAFVDYLAVDEPAEGFAEAVGEGLARGCEQAGVELVAGETAVMPEVIEGFDLAGACAGLASKDAPFPGEAEPGDSLVAWPASGIHSNGLTLAREAVTREHDYGDPFPPDPERTIGEVLLEPTRIYADLLGPLREHGVRAAAHVTGGGWTNLERMGEHRYEVTDPFPAQPVFEFVQDAGDVADEEMYRTFNMGMGFVAAVPPERAVDLAGAGDGRIVGRVGDGDGVSVRGLEL
ncbi:phosphoribosylformylglycinamidine cyclo-ligase [Halobacteriales archaeon QS_1_68_20]|nr:MAG: phosphoribosylformylglycinamidine cyclo-ligase [Halobacteriales archaeon QS_1_68_20]